MRAVQRASIDNVQQNNKRPLTANVYCLRGLADTIFLQQLIKAKILVLSVTNNLILKTKRMDQSLISTKQTMELKIAITCKINLQ